MPNNPQFHHHHLHQNDNYSPNPIPNPHTATGAGQPLRPVKPTPNPKFLTLILKSIIMLFVISFFFVFLGIAALAVVPLFLRRRPASPRGGAISPEDLQMFLPGFNYTAGIGVEDCAVCLEGFREGDTCRRLSGCRHVFHSGCVDRWLAKVPNCPICRTRVRLEMRGRGWGDGDDESKVVLWSV